MGRAQGLLRHVDLVEDEAAGDFFLGVAMNQYHRRAPLFSTATPNRITARQQGLGVR
jgi:hypothetical protein